MKNSLPIEQSEDDALGRLLDLRVIQILLAALCSLLGLSRPERAEARERAYRTRAAAHDVNLRHETREHNKGSIALWSQDTRPNWRDSMRLLWIWKRPSITVFLRKAWLYIFTGLNRSADSYRCDAQTKAPP